MAQNNSLKFIDPDSGNLGRVPEFLSVYHKYDSAITYRD
jgi:hypothetical protein